MKAVIVNCFDTYENRVDLIYEYLTNKGYSVTVIQSDFRHFKKEKRNISKDGFIFVKTKPYYKNMSLARMLSHYKYAKDAFKIVEKINPDLVYTFVPPNSLASYASKYKKKYPNVKLVLDLIDLWPETMPIKNFKATSPLKFWGALRDNSLPHANVVITECDLYQEVLEKQINNIETYTIPLAKKEIDVIKNIKLSNQEISLAYLGSINNIIDIKKIKEIIETIVSIKPVTLHIIGDGESKTELINAAVSSGAKIVDHGKKYNPQEKQNIFDECHFGLNIMKESVCVGLTMKSVDYFQHGLPIINNIPADTAKIVEEYKVGINVVSNMSSLVEQIKATEDIEVMIKSRKQAEKVFEDLFSIGSFNKALDASLKWSK